MLLLDGSGSMAADGKIDALNRAISEALPSLRELNAQNPFADLLVRAIVFADGPVGTSLTRPRWTTSSGLL